MGETRQTVEVAIDANELAGVHSLQWSTYRRDITPEGAIGVANNTGLIGLLINGQPAARLWIHEDELGYVVVDVLDHESVVVARLDAELHGIVPPRLGSKTQKKDRRFGGAERPPKG